MKYEVSHWSDSIKESLLSISAPLAVVRYADDMHFYYILEIPRRAIVLMRCKDKVEYEEAFAVLQRNNRIALAGASVKRNKKSYHLSDFESRRTAQYHFGEGAEW